MLGLGVCVSGGKVFRFGDLGPLGLVFGVSVLVSGLGFWGLGLTAL